MYNSEVPALSAEDQIEILQAVLETTRARLGQVVLQNTELEGLLALERKKSSELSDLLSGKKADK